MLSFRMVLGAAVVAAVYSIEIVLDDAGEHIRPGTAWTKAEGNCAQAGYEGGFHHNNGVHSAESFATWNFSIAQDGCYWVEEFHPDTSACDFSLSSRVPIQIHFCRGLHTAGVIDQSQRAGQWNKLVKLPFYTSHSAAIHISAMGMNMQAAGVWAADAFRLTWHHKNCHDESVESDEAVAPSDEEEAKVETPVPVQEEEAKLPLLQALIDDVDTKVLGSTLEPVSQCPATASGTFHHDALQKDRRAQATFHFDPPHDGCYIIEEFHPQLDQCKASANTKVHVSYCKGLKALGTVDQTANQGQWTFLAALPFFAGHAGNVTLSNDGTQPGTLAVFDQVRFTWSGKSCSKVESHPRHAEVRIPVDFKAINNRQAEFGSALKSKLAEWAGISEKALRLTGLRSGSIIASFLVMPSPVDEPDATQMSASAVQAIEKLRDAVAKKADDLCALTGASLEGCQVEFTDLGVAKPSVRPEQRPRPQEKEEAKEETQPEKSFDPVTVIVFVSAFCVLKLAICYFMVKSGKAKREVNVSKEASQAAKSEVESVEASKMEEGKAIEDKVNDEKKPAEDDNTSTLAPSSDKQSEPSLNGDVDEDMKSNLSVVKALSQQDI